MKSLWEGERRNAELRLHLQEEEPVRRDSISREWINHQPSGKADRLAISCNLLQWHHLSLTQVSRRRIRINVP